MKKDALFEFGLYKKAPLFPASLFFILGVVLAAKAFGFSTGENFFGPLIPTYAIAVILFLLLVLATLLYGFKKKAAPAVFAFVAVLGFLTAQVKMESGYGKEPVIAHDRVAGRVKGIQENGPNSLTLVLDGVIVTGDGEKQHIKGRVSLILYGQSASFLESEYHLKNSVVEAESELMYPTDAAGYGFASERLNLISQNIHYKALAHYSSVDIIYESAVPPLYLFFHNMRTELFGRIERYAGGDEAAFLQALLTGNKSALSTEIKSDFSKLGISHLLATSGLHIGILLLAFEYLFRKIRAPIVLRAAISAVVILIFLCFAGFRPSMVRAAFMWAVLMGSRLFGEKLSPLNSLGAAGLFMALLNPLCVFDISFVLSCVSVAAIALFLGSAKTKKIKNSALKAAVTTVAVVAFTWPVIAYYFNGVSLLSPLYNIIFVPLSGAALFLGMLFGIFSGWGFMAAILGTAAKALSFLIIKGAAFFSQFSLSLNLVSPPFLVILLWMAGATLLSGTVVKGKNKLIKIISVSAMVLAAAGMVLFQAQALSRREIKAYADGSVIFIYFEDKGENTLLLNDDSYTAYTVLKKDAEKELDVLIYSGNDPETLEEIIGGLGDIQISKVYAAREVAAEYNIKYGADVRGMKACEILGYEIELIPFKAKSETAKIHYAAHISGGSRSILYLDPLPLREGAFDGTFFSEALSSRWTKSRAENISYIDFGRLYYCSAGIIPYESALLLEQKGANTYNITGSAAILYPKEGE